MPPPPRHPLRPQARWRGARRAGQRAVLVGIEGLHALRRRLPHRPGPARVLLATRNSLMAGNLLRTWECIADAVDAEVWMTAFDGDAVVRERAARSGVHWVGATRSRLGAWDLVLMADHMTLDYAPSVRKVLIGHGVASSRLVRGGTYRYDRARVLDSRGRPVYTRMLDAADETARAAIRAVPECADVIRVVGNLDADDLLRLRDDAAGTRSEIGADGRVLVVVMSSWGADALIPQYGRDLVPELHRLAGTGEYAFVVTMHHNLWSTPDDTWRTLLRSAAAEHVHVVGPDEDAGRFLAAADALVTDNTSYAAKAAALDRPIIPVHVPSESLVPGSFARWLVEHHRPITDVSGLEKALQGRDGYRLRDAPEVVSYLGESALRHREVFLELLPLRTAAR